MRNLILLIALFLTVNIYSQDSSLGWMFVNSNTIALDKQAHFAGGGFIGMSAYFVTLGLTDSNRKKARFWGIATPILVGTIKELSDSRSGGTGFDWADLGYTAGGGITATYTFDFLVGWKIRRDKNKNDEFKKQVALLDNFYE